YVIAIDFAPTLEQGNTWDPARVFGKPCPSAVFGWDVVRSKVSASVGAVRGGANEGKPFAGKNPSPVNGSFSLIRFAYMKRIEEPVGRHSACSRLLPGRLDRCERVLGPIAAPTDQDATTRARIQVIRRRGESRCRSAFALSALAFGECQARALRA